MCSVYNNNCCLCACSLSVFPFLVSLSERELFFPMALPFSCANKCLFAASPSTLAEAAAAAAEEAPQLSTPHTHNEPPTPTHAPVELSYLITGKKEKSPALCQNVTNEFVLISISHAAFTVVRID